VFVIDRFIVGAAAASRAVQNAAETRRNRKSGEVGAIKV
jgi:hypothetical protein